jgi:hypothetical protein
MLKIKQRPKIIILFVDASVSIHQVTKLGPQIWNYYFLTLAVDCGWSWWTEV